MKQAIIYARYSPHPRKKHEVMSNETQVQLCRDYCQTHALDVVAEYRDAGVSGKSIANRPGLEKALVHVCKLRGVLVVHSLSRLARSTRDAIELSETLRKRKADLALVTQKLDTSTPMGRAFFKIMAVVGELEREITGERTSEALRTYQANGKLISRHPPYGFRVDPVDAKCIIRDKGEQDTIRRIITLHHSGLGLRAICRHLDELGISARTGAWHHSLIKSIIDKHI